MSHSKTRSILAATILICTIGASAQAAVIYTEDFNAPGGPNGTFGDAGWTLVAEDGTRHTDDQNKGHLINGGLEGSAGDFRGFINDQGKKGWLVTDAPALTAEIEQVRWIDREADVPYRLGLEVGGTWYLSDWVSTSNAGGFDAGGGAKPGVTITDFSTGFSAWGAGGSSTGAPADDTEAWDLTTLGTSGALPSGNVTRVGLMTSDSSDSRFDVFQVSQVPEPASLATVLVGIGLLIARRRLR